MLPRTSSSPLSPPSPSPSTLPNTEAQESPPSYPVAMEHPSSTIQSRHVDFAPSVSPSPTQPPHQHISPSSSAHPPVSPPSSRRAMVRVATASSVPAFPTISGSICTPNVASFVVSISSAPSSPLSPCLSIPPMSSPSVTSPDVHIDQDKPKRRVRAPANLAHSVGEPQCTLCHITQTSQWRRGPDGFRSLCNACGIRYANKMAKERIVPPSCSLHTMDIRYIVSGAGTSADEPAMRPLSSSSSSSSSSLPSHLYPPSSSLPYYHRLTTSFSSPRRSPHSRRCHPYPPQPQYSL
eukprot:TRINITY_DN7907_c0_g1_i2.p1 TRINITY_DN7907_c0_g1~~TRINITY_DN7907_c0_g1_i2.p1  ORF type:complete len:294 (-),score=53.85 TRINITY_DN7907_c0_g1_i2:151-1032(-)